MTRITTARYGVVLISNGWTSERDEARGSPVPNDEKRKKELMRLLRQSAKLRKQSHTLAAEVKRLRGEIATSTNGRVVERRKKQRLKGK